MSGKLFDRYGAILKEDVDVLEMCLRKLIHENFIPLTPPRHFIRVLEIGMHDRGTAQGIDRFCGENEAILVYTGIDPDDGKSRPRYVPDGGKVIVGDSAEVFNQVPDGLDLVWVDGCHCMNHVILDTVHYGAKVRPGGFMLFHDVNPLGQGEEHQYHGPEIPEFGLAITAAHRAIHFPWDGWTLFAEAWPTEVRNCGTRAYRKALP